MCQISFQLWDGPLISFQSFGLVQWSRSGTGWIHQRRTSVKPLHFDRWWGRSSERHWAPAPVGMGQWAASALQV